MKKIYPETYKTITLGENNYLVGYLNDKCIGFYEENDGQFYPLLITHNENEEFQIIQTNNKLYFILNVLNNNIKSIYNIDLKKVFETKENQKVTIVTNNLEKLGLPYKNCFCKDAYDKLFINLYENNSSILYEVFSQEELLKSSFTNSEFYFYKKLILEAIDNEIKAIYYNGYTFLPQKNKLILKTKWKLKIINFSNDYFVVESNPTNTYSSIYYIGTADIQPFRFVEPIVNKKQSYNNIGSFSLGTDCRLLESGNYLFNLIPSYYTSIFSRHEAEMLLITGSINQKCKAIYFYDNKDKTILRYKTLNKNCNDTRYFEVDKYGFIKVMLNDKCVKILDYKFKTILSIAHRKCHTGNIFFKIHEEYIEKIYKENCIAVYSLNGELLAMTDRFNINIKTCKNADNKMCFLYILDDKCIEIRRNIRHLVQVTGITYDVHFSRNNVIKYICGIRAGKVVGVFNYNLDCIEWIKSPSKCSLEIIDIENNPKEFLYLKKDSNNKITELLNSNKKSIFKSRKNNYLKLLQNKVLEYNKEGKCISIGVLKSNELVKIYHTSKDEYFAPFLLDSPDFIRKINCKFNLESLVYINDSTYIKICTNYETILQCENFFLFLKNNSTQAELSLIQKFYITKHDNYILNAKYGGVLREEILDPLGFIYIVESINNKDVAIYSATTNGFKEIISSESGIKTVYIGNSIFFETNKGVFNKIGNQI